MAGNKNQSGAEGPPYASSTETGGLFEYSAIINGKEVSFQGPDGLDKAEVAKRLAMQAEGGEWEVDTPETPDTKIGIIGAKLLGATKERKAEINPNYDGINPRNSGEVIKDLKSLGVIKGQILEEKQKKDLVELKKIKDDGNVGKQEYITEYINQFGYWPKDKLIEQLNKNGWPRYAVLEALKQQEALITKKKEQKQAAKLERQEQKMVDQARAEQEIKTWENEGGQLPQIQPEELWTEIDFELQRLSRLLGKAKGEERDRIKKEMDALMDALKDRKAGVTPREVITPEVAPTPEASGSSFTVSEIKKMSPEKALGKIAEIQEQINGSNDPVFLRFMRNTLNQFAMRHTSNDVRKMARGAVKIAEEKLKLFPDASQKTGGPENQPTTTPKLSPEEEVAEQTRLTELEEARKRAEGAEEIEALNEIRETEKDILTSDLKSLRDLLRPRLKQLSTAGKSEEVRETAKIALENIEKRIAELEQGGLSPLPSIDVKVGLDLDLSEREPSTQTETSPQQPRTLKDIRAEVRKISDEYYKGTVPPAIESDLNSIRDRISEIIKQSKGKSKTSEQKRGMDELYAEAEKLVAEFRVASLKPKETPRTSEGKTEMVIGRRVTLSEADQMQKLPYMTVENEKRLRELGWTDEDFMEHAIANGAGSRRLGGARLLILEKMEKDDIERIKNLEELKAKNSTLSEEDEEKLKVFRQGLSDVQKELHIKRKMAEYDKHHREEWSKNNGGKIIPTPLREYTLAEYEQYLKDEEAKRKTAQESSTHIEETKPVAEIPTLDKPAIVSVSTPEPEKIPEQTQAGKESGWMKKAYERGEAIAEEFKKLKEEGKIIETGLEIWRGVGEWYNKQPTKTKLAVSLGLTAAALGSGALAMGAGAAVFAGLAGTARVIGSAGTFVFIEKALHIAHAAKTGKERDTGWAEKRQVAEAFIFSILLGGGFASLAGHNIASGRLMDALGFAGGKTNIAAEAIKETIKTAPINSASDVDKPTGLRAFDNAFGDHTIPLEQVTSDELEKGDYQNIPDKTPIGETVPEYSVKSGDNLYKIIRENFSEVKDLPAGKQENAIENILAKISKDPASYGIKGGNINALKIGDSINLEKIHEIIETHKIGEQGIVEHAQGLSDETVERIKNYKSPTDGIKTGVLEQGKVDIFAEVRDVQIEKGGEDIILSEPKAIVGDENNIYRGAESTASGEMLAKHFETSPESLKGVLRGPDIVAIEDARNMLAIKLDTTFGQKGFFGFGATSGEKSADWLAFKGKTIGELLTNKSPSESVLKVRNFVGELGGASGQIARRSETVEDFVKRALIGIVRTGKQITT